MTHDTEHWPLCVKYVTPRSAVPGGRGCPGRYSRPNRGHALTHHVVVRVARHAITDNGLNELLNLSLKRLNELNRREFVACGPQAGKTGKGMPEGHGPWRNVAAQTDLPLAPGCRWAEVSMRESGGAAGQKEGLEEDTITV